MASVANLKAKKLIKLHRPPFPTAAGLEEIRRSQFSCSVCCNLSPGTAFSLIPRQDIIVGEASGTWNQWYGKKALNPLYHGKKPEWAGNSHGITVDEVVPSWAGTSRMDLASWQITTSLPDIAAAARDGCPSCQLIKHGIQELSNDRISFVNEDLALVIVFCKGNVLQANLCRLEPLDENDESSSPIFDVTDNFARSIAEYLDSFEFYTLLGKGCPWPTIGSRMNLEDPFQAGAPWRGGEARHVPTSSTSENCVALIRHWLQECLETHPECNKNRSSKQQPKRLISIGSSDSGNIRIIETDQTITNTSRPYIALSHCWGLSQHLISTKKTLSNWERDIPWIRLPKTFQDSIIIARSLGVEFLWIDSLCIIQDDAQDWEMEAANMGHIYSNAFLVISAASSPDGKGGCFLERSKYVVIEGEDEHQNTFSTYIRHSRRHGVFGWNVPSGSKRGDQSSTKYEEPNFPLFGRAWCFQERLLGTRILHYTNQEVVFECLSSSNCECGALANFKSDPTLQLRRSLCNLPAQMSVEMEILQLEYDGTRMLQLEHGFQTWRDLVSTYTRRSLTRVTDILPALSGIAERYSSQLKSEYLGGLWRDDLLRGLLWVSAAPDEGKDIPYLAPTWSWASISRAIEWAAEESRSDYLVTFDTAKSACVYKGQNIFGELESGWLFLTGPILRGTISIVSRDKSNLSIVFESTLLEGKVRFDADDWDKCSQLVGSEALCLMYCTDVLNEKTGGGFHRALILGSPSPKIIGGLPQSVQQYFNVYQRLGVVRFYPAENWNNGDGLEVMSLYLV